MGFWKKLWEGWKRLAHRIGTFQSRLLLVVIYFVLIAPVALLFRLFKDPLRIRAAEPSWDTRTEEPASIDSLRRQF